MKLIRDKLVYSPYIAMIAPSELLHKFVHKVTKVLTSKEKSVTLSTDNCEEWIPPADS